VRRTISTKEVEYVPDARGGAVRREVPADRRDEPCLAEEELATLVDVGRRVERHFGLHQDVEWALARGRRLPESLFLVQARPVTTRPAQAPKLSGSALSLVMSTFGASPDPPASS
jgi:pyruvate,water dikinase